MEILLEHRGYYIVFSCTGEGCSICRDYPDKLPLVRSDSGARVIEHLPTRKMLPGRSNDTYKGTSLREQE